MQLVALLETNGVLDVRRGHGRGHVNFYRILREEDGLPIPSKRRKKVKSATPSPEEKVKFPTPPELEKVKSEPAIPLETLEKAVDKVVEYKERKDKADTPASLSSYDLKRLGLTPGSVVWNLLLGSDEAGQQQPGT
jgi:hypothetical protein